MPEDIFAQLRLNTIVCSPLFPEPVQVIVTMPAGDAIRLVGTRLEISRTYRPILFANQLTTLEVAPEVMPFEGDAS